MYFKIFFMFNDSNDPVGHTARKSEWSGAQNHGVDHWAAEDQGHSKNTHIHT